MDTESGDGQSVELADDVDDDGAPEGETAAEAQARRRRRRGRRGGRRRREGEVVDAQANDGEADALPGDVEPYKASESIDVQGMEVQGMETALETVDDPLQAPEAVEDLPEPEAPPKRKRPTRKKKVDDEIVLAPAVDPEPVAVEVLELMDVATSVAEVPAKEIEVAALAIVPTDTSAMESVVDDESNAGAKRSGWWSRNAKKLFGSPE